MLRWVRGVLDRFLRSKWHKFPQLPVIPNKNLIVVKECQKIFKLRLNPREDFPPNLFWNWFSAKNFKYSQSLPQKNGCWWGKNMWIWSVLQGKPTSVWHKLFERTPIRIVTSSSTGLSLDLLRFDLRLFFWIVHNVRFQRKTLLYPQKACVCLWRSPYLRQKSGLVFIEVGGSERYVFALLTPSFRAPVENVYCWSPTKHM